MDDDLPTEPQSVAGNDLRTAAGRAAEVRARAGCVSLRRCRATGTLVGVYRAEEAGLDPEGGAWATVCEHHGAVLNSHTRAEAEAVGVFPEWCARCQEYLFAPRFAWPTGG